MKAVKLFQSVGLVLVSAFVFSLNISAQETAPKKTEKIASTKADKKKSKKRAAESSVIEAKKTDSAQTTEAADDKKSDDKKDDKNLRRETMSEDEAAIIPYYNNYMKEYRLGPQDVISVEVFGQCPDYCKSAITVPPTARISYPLIKNGVSVGGKTVDEVAEEIKKQLDEYIIDPNVTVTLEKVGSARYSVLGDVGTPGVKMMERRLSVYEAIVESGGVTRTGDSKRVSIVRQTATGLTSIPVNLQEIARGKAEMVYLVPGDQVIVPGNKIKTIDRVLEIIGKVSAFRLLFGSPF
ncbi:MAG: polysaccharide export protein [Acidobacteriota bacterium]|nr:polysaccharide export protein [Acidobacteriota bacterium]